LLAEQNRAAIEANRRRIFEAFKGLKSEGSQIKIGVHLVGDCKAEGTMSQCVAAQNVLFEIENLSSDRVFVQIMDLGTSGSISLKLRSILVNPGQKVRSILLTFGPPYGVELFKVFASIESVDLSVYEYSADAIDASGLAAYISSPLVFDVQPKTANPPQVSRNASPNAWSVLDYSVVIQPANIRYCMHT
jgi:hypothetical protein